MNEEEFRKLVAAEPKRADVILDMFEFSKAIGTGIRWGTGSTVATANIVFNYISPRSVYTLYSTGDISFNYGWLKSSDEGNNEMTEAYSNNLRKALYDAGFKVTTGKSDFWHTLRYSEWSERPNELKEIFRSVLREYQVQ